MAEWVENVAEDGRVLVLRYFVFEWLFWDGAAAFTTHALQALKVN